MPVRLSKPLTDFHISPSSLPGGRLSSPVSTVELNKYLQMYVSIEAFRNLESTVSKLQERMGSLQEDNTDLREKLRRLKKSCKRKIVDEDSPQLYSKIQNIDDIYKALLVLCCDQFEHEEIVTHSLTGRASNSKCKAKPPLDQQKMAQIITALEKRFPQCINNRSIITKKFHSVQKTVLKLLQKGDKVAVDTDNI